MGGFRLSLRSDWEQTPVGRLGVGLVSPAPGRPWPLLASAAIHGCMHMVSGQVRPPKGGLWGARAILARSAWLLNPAPQLMQGPESTVPNQTTSGLGGLGYVPSDASSIAFIAFIAFRSVLHHIIINRHYTLRCGECLK